MPEFRAKHGRWEQERRGGPDAAVVDSMEPIPRREPGNQGEGCILWNSTLTFADK